MAFKFTNVWPQMEILETAAGVFISKYHPNGPDAVEIVGPEGQSRGSFTCHGLASWKLREVGGKIEILYSRYVEGGQDTTSIPTSIPTGGPATPPPNSGKWGVEGPSFPGVVQPSGNATVNGIDFGGQAVRCPRVQIWEVNAVGEVWTKAWEFGALVYWERVPELEGR